MVLFFVFLVFRVFDFGFGFDVVKLYVFGFGLVGLGVFVGY